MDIFQIILTIICGFGAFSVTYLLGSAKQKEKDEKQLRTYRAEAEEQIADINRERAKAETEFQRIQAEKELVVEASKIVKANIFESSNNEDLKQQVLEAKTESDVKASIADIIKDSQSRAKEVEG